MVFTKTLNITRGDVGGRPVTLLLTFQVPDPSRLYRDQFSIAWRVIPFSGYGSESVNVEYCSQLIVAIPQITSGSHVKPNLWIEIDPGQKTTLEKQGSGVVFTEPVKGVDNLIIAENDTGDKQDFTIGIVKGQSPTPILYFPDIRPGSAVSLQFIPVLQAYVISDYQETALLRGEIESKVPIWSQDLTRLRESTDWVFEQDPTTGEYVIKAI